MRYQRNNWNLIVVKKSGRDIGKYVIVNKIHNFFTKLYNFCQ